MERDYTIYAVDFDGTLCKSKYPGMGEPNEILIEQLKARRVKGDKLILWTCRCGKPLQDAIEWCKLQGLEFDCVNENIPEILVPPFDTDCRKVFADYYIDDKAVEPFDQLVLRKE